MDMEAKNEEVEALCKWGPAGAADVVVVLCGGATLRLPVGWSFKPSGRLLLNLYLLSEINGVKEPLAVPIPEIHHLYSLDPDQIPIGDFKSFCHENEAYFFTYTELRTGPTPSYRLRNTTKGFWKFTGFDKEIIDEGQIIGYERRWAHYEGKQPNAKKTNWNIHEFRLEPSLVPAALQVKDDDLRYKVQNYVVCKIFLHVPKSKRTGSSC